MSAATRIDYKRELYTAGHDPVMVQVPELAYFMIDGHGDPNTVAEYGEAVEALYSVAYAAKFAITHAPETTTYDLCSGELTARLLPGTPKTVTVPCGTSSVVIGGSNTVSRGIDTKRGDLVTYTVTGRNGALTLTGKIH